MVLDLFSVQTFADISLVKYCHMRADIWHTSEYTYGI